MRTPIIAGNWKMNLNVMQSEELLSGLKDVSRDNIEIIVCPSFTALSKANEILSESKIKLGAQDMFYEDKGAYTGEISPSMVKELCEYVIIGHSERRMYFNETNEIVNRKTKSGLKNGLKVIFCVGETLEIREAGHTFDTVKEQIVQGLEGINELKDIIIAYEPVWAIGTGKTATPDQAEEVHRFIRDNIKELYDEETAESIRILYGGSVNPGNVDELMSEKDIDGALVGGASLKAEDFIRLIEFKN